MPTIYIPDLRICRVFFFFFFFFLSFFFLLPLTPSCLLTDFEIVDEFLLLIEHMMRNLSDF